jgi:predicted nucleic acid-binding protein
MMVLDTDVFIDHVRGQEAATAYIHSLPMDQPQTAGALSGAKGQP